MASVSFRNVSKSFGKISVLHGVSLEIEDTEFMVLVGPSGCGKSTLLRMMAGLENITCGEILIDGRPVNDLPPKGRDIAMVFQSYALYPHMTVRENIGFGLKMSGEERSAVEASVQRVARSLELEQYLDRYPRQLSGGQRQRVAMGRAIVRNPKAFLFDEPLSNLDAKFRVQVRTELKALHQRLRTTSVYVTHDQIEAMTLADRIAVMCEGTLQQAGRPLEVYDHPANLFVAGFIGSPAMNLLAGELRREGGRPWISLPGGARLPLPGQTPGEEGCSLVYGCRPEHVRVVPAELGVATEVCVVEPTGADTYVHARLGEIKLCFTVKDRRQFSAGERVFLRPELESVHVFDPKTGVALVS